MLSILLAKYFQMSDEEFASVNRIRFTNVGKKQADPVKCIGFSKLDASIILGPISSSSETDALSDSNDGSDSESHPSIEIEAHSETSSLRRSNRSTKTLQIQFEIQMDGKKMGRPGICVQVHLKQRQAIPQPWGWPLRIPAPVVPPVVHDYANNAHRTVSTFGPPSGAERSTCAHTLCALPVLGMRNILLKKLSGSCNSSTSTVARRRPLSALLGRRWRLGVSSSASLRGRLLRAISNIV
jgi:hypothetical protein